jgi:tetratricopeptide (TPR) repeat protein
VGLFHRKTKNLGLALAAVAVLAGCGGGGSDKDKAQAVVKTYLGALADGDGEKACDQMTGELKRETVDTLPQDVPALKNLASCKEVVAVIADNIGGDEKQKLRNIKFAATTVNGDEATVKVEGATSDVELRKSDGRWYISGGLLGESGGGSGQPSVSEAQNATQKDPNDAKAWHDLAMAYDITGQTAAAISAWTTYATLRPKDVDGLTALASDYEQQFSSQTKQAAAAQTAKAKQRLADALAARQSTAEKLEAVYHRIAALHEPPEPSDQLLLAQAAQNAGDNSTAIAAYKKFIQLSPDDPNASYAKQQIKALSRSQG